MSHGFLATNANNQVLVSSDTRNLHFIGKPGVNQVRNTFDTHGGCRIFTYLINSAVPVVPFFTMPTSDLYGITAIRNVGGNTWEIEVLRSGTSTALPELYVFADPRAVSPSESHGMLVYRDDGTPSFDSRLRPLAITGGLSVVPPQNPKPVLPFGLDPKNCLSSVDDAGAVFAPDQFSTYSTAIPSSKPMFSYASIAQAQRDATYSISERECDGGSFKGNCIGVERDYYWNSTYWAFYRGAIRGITGGLQAGWVTVAYGCNWTYLKESTLIGIGTGGDSGSGGAWPYSNETLNLTSSPIIFADASRYD
jgi:hypothetical protein